MKRYSETPTRNPKNQPVYKDQQAQTHPKESHVYARPFAYIWLCDIRKLNWFISSGCNLGRKKLRKALKMASSSGPAKLFEEKMEQLQNELDELRGLINQQSTKQTRLQKTGTNRWELLNQELKELLEEIFDDTQTHVLDIANISGSLGNRLVKLEKQVEELLKAQTKTE